jgi:hypothetical protein
MQYQVLSQCYLGFAAPSAVDSLLTNDLLVDQETLLKMMHADT